MPPTPAEQPCVIPLERFPLPTETNVERGDVSRALLSFGNSGIRRAKRMRATPRHAATWKGETHSERKHACRAFAANLHGCRDDFRQKLGVGCGEEQVVRREMFIENSSQYQSMNMNPDTVPFFVNPATPAGDGRKQWMQRWSSNRGGGGFRVWRSGFRAQGQAVGFRAQSSGFIVQSSGCKDQDSGCRV